MPIREVPHKRSGGTVRFGRRRPISRGPRLALRNYMTGDIPPPPPTCDYSAAASAALSLMYGNDRLGDCVIAGIGHIVGTLTSDAGDPFTYSDDQIIGLYEAIGGYDPNNPAATDNGCDEVTALNYWENNGAPAGSHRIAGWLEVNARDPGEVRTALYLFENLFFGMELPDAWLDSMRTSSTIAWDVAGPPDQQNGHCVVGVGYDTSSITISTWGQLGTITNGAVAKYASGSANGALYAVVSTDALNNTTALSASGLDWSQLVADFDSMGGNVTPGGASLAGRGPLSRRQAFRKR